MFPTDPPAKRVLKPALRSPPVEALRRQPTASRKCQTKQEPWGSRVNDAGRGARGTDRRAGLCCLSLKPAENATRASKKLLSETLRQIPIKLIHSSRSLLVALGRLSDWFNAA